MKWNKCPSKMISLYTLISFQRGWRTCQKVLHQNSRTRNLNECSYLSKKFCSKLQESIPIECIRNFCIIAHVDHGKSTLADRFLEITGAIQESKENKQVLDRLPVERERGITVKAVAASLNYTFRNIKYQLNLIDTPGHVDFSNEVSRSLYACQGVILLVDVKQGVQAQTVANYHLAKSSQLVIIPVLNKIDLKNAKPDVVEAELKSLFDCESLEVSRISAKTGLGVEDLLKLIIEKVPYPKVSREKPFRALIIDSWHENFRGSILFIYIMNGNARVGDEITCYRTSRNYQIKTIGKLRPQEVKVELLEAGEIGVISCSMKDPKEAFVGDTIYSKGQQIEDLEVLKPPKPMVFAGLFPKSQVEHLKLKSSIGKLTLNDPSVSIELESLPSLGSGWRLGFLGLLHLDVFRQRLEQEFGTEVILTAPSVTYKLKITGAKNIKKFGGRVIYLRNPSFFPDYLAIEEMYEPVILVTIITPVNHLKEVYNECISRRGIEQETIMLTENRSLLKFVMPLNEVMVDFHDTLKRLTSGYASFDYEEHGYMPTSLDQLVILVNGKEVEELTTIVHSSRKVQIGKNLVEKLERLIPRQQVTITIQASVRGQILARADIKPYRKDVTAKLHAADPSRRMKLIRAQNQGKAQMRKFANIEVPRDVFIDVLRQY